MYVLPLSGGPPIPHGLAEHSFSSAAHTRGGVRKAAPTLAAGTSGAIELVLALSAPARWLPVESTAVKTMRVPSALAHGWTHWTWVALVCTPLSGLQFRSPVEVRKYSFAPPPSHAAIVPSVRL